MSLKEVIHTVIKADGVQHLISMATSEHVIMQNEALVALAIASAIDIGKTFTVSLFKLHTIYVLSCLGILMNFFKVILSSNTFLQDTLLHQ